VRAVVRPYAAPEPAWRRRCPPTLGSRKTTRSGIDRPAGGGLAEPAAGAPAGPRVLVEPGRDLPVHLPTEGPDPNDFADLDRLLDRLVGANGR